MTDWIMVSELEKANVPSGYATYHSRGPVGCCGELTDEVSRAVSLSLGNSGQLAAFLLDRIDHANQSLKERRIACLGEKNPSGLARVAGCLSRKPERKNNGITQQLVAHLGQVCAQ
jgi:hypothetical protein